MGFTARIYLTLLALLCSTLGTWLPGFEEAQQSVAPVVVAPQPFTICDIRTSYIVDHARSLTPAEILGSSSENWIDAPTPQLLTFGYTNAAVWCHIRFESNSDPGVIIELPTTRIDHVTWYAVIDGRPALIAQNGFKDSDQHGYAPQSYPLAELARSKSGKYDVLFRAESACALAIPINIQSASALTNLNLRRCAWAHLEIGITVTVAAVCLTLSVLFRDLSLGVLAVCGISVVCYGVTFDTVSALPGYRCPSWLPRSGCSFFCALQAISMLAFAGTHAEFRNLDKFDRVVFWGGVVGSLAFLLLHNWLAYSALVPWVNWICILDSMCSVWIISIGFRSDRQVLNFLPIAILMLSHAPGLLLILYFQGISPVEFSPQSFRMIATPIVYCGLAYSLLQRRRNSESLRLRVAMAHVSESNSRLNALRYQLNPHMLLNSLTAISSLSRRAPHQIPSLIQSLSAILHARLQPATITSWTVHEEMSLARDLIAVEQVRFDGQLSFVENVAPQYADLHLPEMLLQPLVENALKYASSTTGPPEVRLEICSKQEQLVIRILNSVDSESLHYSGSGLKLGQNNVRDRLDIFYNGKAAFRFTIEDGKAVSEISIPLKLCQTPRT